MTQSTTLWKICFVFVLIVMIDGAFGPWGRGSGPLDLLRERQVGPLGVVGFGETTRLPDRFALFFPPKYGRFLYQNECYCMFDTQQCLFVIGSVLPKIDKISGHCKQTASNHTEQLAIIKKYIYRLQLHDSCTVCR